MLNIDWKSSEKWKGGIYSICKGGIYSICKKQLKIVAYLLPFPTRRINICIVMYTYENKSLYVSCSPELLATNSENTSFHEFLFQFCILLTNYVKNTWDYLIPTFGIGL